MLTFVKFHVYTPGLTNERFLLDFTKVCVGVCVCKCSLVTFDSENQGMRGNRGTSVMLTLSLMPSA